MMATSWDFNRKPWVVQSGGSGSKVFKTTDGGITWKEINKGLPELKGKTGISISPANPKIVYMAIEAKGKKGGVYRSDNSGESFKQTTNDPTTYARAWYYMHIIADPTDEDELWVLNSSAMKSIDGGKSFKGMRGSHVDHHDLWINPNNSQNMINGNDGGGSITNNAGKTWSTLFNQPTGQFYRVITDNQYPYRLYSGQQDNSTIAIDSRVADNGIGQMHWDIMRAGESSTVAFDPDNPRYVYSTYFASNFIEWDRDIDNTRMVMPYPERVSGEQPKNLKYRANWNGPVIVSPHNPDVIYYGSQYMMKSTDRGVTWEVISEDLSQQIDRNTLKVYDRVVSIDAVAKNGSTSLFGSIVAFSESPIDENLLAAGTDDGLIHITENGGQTWRKVSKVDGAPNMSYVNAVYLSKHDVNVMYAAFNHHKYGDFKPYIFMSSDKGKTWKSISSNLPKGSIYAIEEDHINKNLIFCGTEYGAFFSPNNGQRWKELSAALPTIAVRDIAIQERENDLVLGTFGRGFYVLDDYSALRSIENKDVTETAIIYPIREALSWEKSMPLGLPGKAFQGDNFFTAPNLGPEAMITYYYNDSYKTLKEKRTELENEITKKKEGTESTEST